MEGRAGGRSHRPTNVNELIARAITWTGVGWMILDTTFTISRAFEAFKPPNFFARVFVAVALGATCGVSQKVLFEWIVNSSKREQFFECWNKGWLGKLACLLICSIMFWLIHFSWNATANSIGIAKGAVIIPNFGIQDLVPISGYLSGMLAGLAVAFLDEMLFFFAVYLKD